MRRQALLLLATVWGARLAAQSPADPHAVQPERPTVATHAYEVAPGWVEVEAGAEFDRYRDGSRGGSAPVVVKIGLVPRVQLELQGSAVSPPAGRSGIGDVTLAAKWRPFEHSPYLGDIAFQPSVTLPTGSATSGTGAGVAGYGILFISSRQIGPVALDLNFGYTHRGGDGSSAPQNATLWTVSAGAPVTGRLGWVLEVFGYPATRGLAGAASSAALLTGPTFLVRPWLALDLGVIQRLEGGQPNALYFGVVYNVGRAWGGER